MKIKNPEITLAEEEWKRHAYPGIHPRALQ